MLEEIGWKSHSRKVFLQCDEIHEMLSFMNKFALEPFQTLTACLTSAESEHYAAKAYSVRFFLVV